MKAPTLLLVLFLLMVACSGAPHKRTFPLSIPSYVTCKVECLTHDGRKAFISGIHGDTEYFMLSDHPQLLQKGAVGRIFRFEAGGNVIAFQ